MCTELEEEDETGTESGAEDSERSVDVAPLQSAQDSVESSPVDTHDPVVFLERSLIDSDLYRRVVVSSEPESCSTCT